MKQSDIEKLAFAVESFKRAVVLEFIPIITSCAKAFEVFNQALLEEIKRYIPTLQQINSAQQKRARRRQRRHRA